MLSPGPRKLVLTSHVVASVGWLGAVGVFLALSLSALTSNELETVRSAYLVMATIGWYVLVPLSVASLVTGLVQSLGTPWGLFRHYWVIFKLAINLVATVVLVMYMQTLEAFSALAAMPHAGLVELRSASPAVHATGALVLLLIATVLSVYKPRGTTRYGQRRGNTTPPGVG